MQEIIVLLIVVVAFIAVIKYYKPTGKKRCTGCDAGCDSNASESSHIKFYKNKPY